MSHVTSAYSNTSLRKLAVAFSCAVLFGCASESTNNTDKSPGAIAGTRVDPGKAYETAIAHYSDGEAEYNGFYNNFQYKATLLNSVIRTELLDKQQHDYQWDRPKLMAETEKSDKEASASTIIFLSFYTPDRRNDNLTDTKSIWKVYLDSAGQRYEGHVRKVHQLTSELQSLYPYHTRWNTPYTVLFPIPTGTIQGQPSTLTITGPLGAKTVKFPEVAR